MFKRAMRRLAAGVSIITTSADGQWHGLAATSVCSVTVDPPALLVCVNRAARSHEAIRRSGLFCVNVLREGDSDLVRRFSTQADRETRFAEREWTTISTGAPALVGAAASFDCRLLQAIDVHSHTIFVGDAVAVELWQEEHAPLVYHDGTFRSLQDAQPRMEQPSRPAPLRRAT
jgi:flavin reductase